MTAATDYLELAVLKHIFSGTNGSTNGATYTAPTTFYVSLHTGDPGEGTQPGANEISISGYNYARESVTFGDCTTVTNTTSVSSNQTVSFGQASANYPADITYIGINDASTGGNLLFYGQLSQAKTVTTGDVFQINSGSLTITLN